MESSVFLSAVLPTQGKYCVFTMRGKLLKNIFVEDLDNLEQTCEQLSNKGQQTYFALATFDDEGYRKAENALFVRSLFMDLDCGVDGKTGNTKAFASKREAVAALVKFLADTGLDKLGTPWLVDSGGGVHVYLPLSRDCTIDEWRPVANALKQVAKHAEFPLDMTVTADAARVLRTPGTLNHKYTPPKPVLLKQRGDIFELDEIAGVLHAYQEANPVSAKTVLAPVSTSALALPGRRPGGQMSAIAKSLMGNSVTYFKNIMVRTVEGDGCGQLAHYAANASEDGMEPLWRGLLSLAKFCEDADKATRKLSAMHPYDEDRRLRKLSEIKGPYSCVKMDSENPGICGDCKHWGKITNPLALGRETKLNTEERDITIEPEDDDEPVVTVHRPTPPRGFSYGDHGGVYVRIPAKGEVAAYDAMLTSYDLFMTNLLRDGSEYLAEFTALKGSKRITFAVPLKAITSQSDCIKELASNNILPTLGPGYGKHLWEYVHACVQDASVVENVVNVPPRFGWQDDGGFAIGNTVMSSHSPTYNYEFVSKDKHNLIAATTCSGTLEAWAEVYYMMMRKGLWGHLACAGAGFGSILMHFMPAGSNAATLHITSTDSGNGKTLAQTMATSVWGNNKRYLIAPTTSEKTMMQRASLLGSLPLCVDEITSNNREINREWVPRFVFDYAAGMHKVKGQATGNKEIQHDAIWSGVAIITSNTPALEAMMGARKHTSEGEARRMLEWVLPKGKLEWTAAEREILRNLETNYGHAGRKYIQWCVLNKETVQKVLVGVMDRWRVVSGCTDDERFWTAKIVCNIAGYILASSKHACVIDIPVKEIVNFWFDLVNRQRKIIAGNQTTAIDILNAYTREHNGSFVQAEAGAVLQHLGGKYAIAPNTARTAVRGRVEYDVTPGFVDHYIEEKLLKNHCAEIGVGYAGFLAELEQAVTVRIGLKNLLAGTKGPSLRVTCVRVTRPIKEVKKLDGTQ